jgi:hypothetical protein
MKEPIVESAHPEEFSSFFAMNGVVLEAFYIPLLGINLLSYYSGQWLVLQGGEVDGIGIIVIRESAIRLHSYTFLDPNLPSA